MCLGLEKEPHEKYPRKGGRRERKGPHAVRNQRNTLSPSLQIDEKKQQRRGKGNP